MCPANFRSQDHIVGIDIGLFVVQNRFLLWVSFVECVAVFCMHAHTNVNRPLQKKSARECAYAREVGGWGRVPFSRNLMSPTPRRKWYLTTGRRAH